MDLSELLQSVVSVNSAVNSFVWGVPAIICILGVGLLLSFRTGFVQIRKFAYAMKNTIGKAFDKQEAGHGMLTPFQAVCTALAGTVGTANIAGVAGAIAIGGPGAVFWMWISALLGMCTKYAEVTLAVHFREVNDRGEVVGGPMYYIKNGLGKQWHWLAVLFSLFGVFAVFGTGVATQANSIVSAVATAAISLGAMSQDSVPVLNFVLGCVITILVALVIFGGVKRIGQVTEKLVPFMLVMYIALGLGVVIVNFREIPGVFASIIYGAFNPTAVTGGVVGSFLISMQRGIARGIFSNEAGMGTGSIAHSTADVETPVQQGIFGIFEVFADTLVVCTLTALVILCSGVYKNYGEAAGAELTIAGFASVYGSWISIMLALALSCFAFSSMIGWGLYGSRCVEFLFSAKWIKPFMVVYVLVAIPGACADLGLMWSIAETFNGLMALPNLIALLLLSGTVVKLTKEYFGVNDAKVVKSAARIYQGRQADI
jgi:AGCS family alanine or glycine:cation symporter